MTVTYDAIASTTLSSAANSITFSSISSGFTDLRLVLVATTAADVGCSLRFNSDTGTNYSITRLRGNGETASSQRFTNQTMLFAGSTIISTTNPSLRTIDIFSYAGSTNKTVLIFETADFNGIGGVSSTVGLWRNTAAISSVTVLTSDGTTNFSIGTTATLYGIKAE